MFAIKLLIFCFYLVSALFGLVLLLGIFVFLRWLINSIKKHIVWAFIHQVSHLTLYPPQKRYRREAVETGYSMGSHYRSGPVYHYRYQTVFAGTYRSIIVRFSNNFKLKINIKEEGLLYKKLTSAAKTFL